MFNREIIYFDHAATSGKKPQAVIDAVLHCLQFANANPGRSAHFVAQKAQEIIYNTREALGRFFHFSQTENIILTKNATEALNIILLGFLRPGDEVVTTSMEHNSVLRPLSAWQEKGVTVKIIEADHNGRVSAKRIGEALQKKTRLVAATAASNAFGTQEPWEEIAQVCHEHGVKILVDGAQGAGSMRMDLAKNPVDFLALAGHKHLLGLQGTGALLIQNPDEVAALLRGGTGSLSDQIIQPDFTPDKWESGTLNTPGFAGLGAALEFLMQEGLEKILAREAALTAYLIERLRSVEKVKIYAPDVPRTATVSFNIEGAYPSDVAYYLDQQWNICARPGLHCAPLAHKTMSTFPTGTIRFSLSLWNTEREIDIAIEALQTYIYDMLRK